MLGLPVVVSGFSVCLSFFIERGARPTFGGDVGLRVSSSLLVMGRLVYGWIGQVN